VLQTETTYKNSQCQSVVAHLCSTRLQQIASVICAHLYTTGRQGGSTIWEGFVRGSGGRKSPLGSQSVGIGLGMQSTEAGDLLQIILQ